MTKKEMAVKLAKQAEISVSMANEILSLIFDAGKGKGIIATELDAGRKVTVPGFGTFGSRKRSSRTGTNPATGAKIKIPARKYPYFKAGKTLKERVER